MYFKKLHYIYENTNVLIHTLILQKFARFGQFFTSVFFIFLQLLMWAILLSIFINTWQSFRTNLVSQFTIFVKVSNKKANFNRVKSNKLKMFFLQKAKKTGNFWFVVQTSHVIVNMQIHLQHQSVSKPFKFNNEVQVWSHFMFYKLNI